MSKKILFSPVGGTDPISNFRDGSILHICRIYKPDEVYLFLSKEMLDIHLHDNRYLYCINKLGELLNHKFSCHIISDEKLIEVQDYDIFYKRFSIEVENIKNKMDKNDILYFNTSSGTPAMKNALFVMATVGEYKMIPLQVSTPVKQINLHKELSDKEYSVELYWEYNEDNKTDFENRCREVRSINLISLLKTDLIIKHIRAYNYNAALEVAETINDVEGTRLHSMLKLACYRSALNIISAKQIADKISWDIFPVKSGQHIKVFEYAMILWLKMKKEEYADYIRAITPLIVNLYEMILQKECGIELKNLVNVEYNEKTNEEIKRWNRAKIRQNRPDIMEIFDKEYKNGFKDKTPVYSIHIAKIIQGITDDNTLKKKINIMTEVEQKIRNTAAHTIISISDDDIKKWSGYNSEQIFELIKYFCIKSGISLKKEIWNTYDIMNKDIEGKINI